MTETVIKLGLDDTNIQVYTTKHAKRPRVPPKWDYVLGPGSWSNEPARVYLRKDAACVNMGDSSWFL